MVLAEAGEDEVLYTEDGTYAANVEKAVSLPADAVPSEFKQFEKLDTPNTPTIASLAKFLHVLSHPQTSSKMCCTRPPLDSGSSLFWVAGQHSWRARMSTTLKLSNELS